MSWVFEWKLAKGIGLRKKEEEEENTWQQNINKKTAIANKKEYKGKERRKQYQIRSCRGDEKEKNKNSILQLPNRSGKHYVC